MPENITISKITRRMDLLNVLSDNMRSNYFKDSTINLTIDNNDKDVLFDDEGKPIENIKSSDLKNNNLNRNHSKSFNDLINKPIVKVDKKIDGVDRLD